MPADTSLAWGEWIWVPVGFAHGNFFTEETVIEYCCTGQYNPKCEASISPLTQDLDWSMADPSLQRLLDEVARIRNCSPTRTETGSPSKVGAKTHDPGTFSSANSQADGCEEAMEREGRV